MNLTTSKCFSGMQNSVILSISISRSPPACSIFIMKNKPLSGSEKACSNLFARVLKRNIYFVTPFSILYYCIILVDLILDIFCTRCISSVCTYEHVSPIDPHLSVSLCRQQPVAHRVALSANRQIAGQGTGGAC